MVATFEGGRVLGAAANALAGSFAAGISFAAEASFAGLASFAVDGSFVIGDSFAVCAGGVTAAGAGADEAAGSGAGIGAGAGAVSIRVGGAGMGRAICVSVIVGRSDEPVSSHCRKYGIVITMTTASAPSTSSARSQPADRRLRDAD